VFGDISLVDVGCRVVGFEGVSFSFWCLVVFVFGVVSIYLFSEVGM
jgi:hypothetical protein